MSVHPLRGTYSCWKLLRNSKFFKWEFSENTLDPFVSDKGLWRGLLLITHESLLIQHLTV